MGSVIGMVDAAGSSTATIKYDSFGNVTSAVGASAGIDPAVGTDFRFHGMQLDAASGLYHVRARTYDARTGRFTSRDSVDGDVERPESYHPYRFANNNPQVWRDPLGLFDMREMAAVLMGLNYLAQTAIPRFAPILRAFTESPAARATVQLANQAGAAAGRFVDIGMSLIRSLRWAQQVRFGPNDLVIGLDQPTIRHWAARYGGQTYANLSSSGSFSVQIREAMMRASKIRVRWDGVNPSRINGLLNSFGEPAAGYTNYELYLLQTTPEFMRKAVFYVGDKVVSSGGLPQ